MTVAFNGMTSAERCHKRILSVYSEMQNQKSEEDTIPSLYLMALSEEEITNIHRLSSNIWDAIALTAIVMQSKL